MKKIFILFFSLALLHTTAFSQNYFCENSLLFCTDTVNTYPAGVNAGTAQSGADYTCLGTQPNPAWYYMKVLNSGPIYIHMSSTPQVDIDFSLWGPFTDQTTPCVAQLTAGNTVDCSYSTSWNETADILNAQTGQIYIILICNYSNQPCNINFVQQNAGLSGAGSLNCFTINNNSPLCEGQTLNLSSLSIPVNSSYYWTGPNGFVSTLQSPVIDSVTFANAGDYFLQIINGTDTTEAISATIIINPLPIVDLEDDTVLCDNVTMVLNAGNGYNCYHIWETDSHTQTISNNQTIAVSASTYGLGSHKFWVTVYCASGCANTDTILVTFQECSGIDEISPDDLIIFPNPAHDNITVDLSGNLLQNALFEIYDILGRVVLSDVLNPVYSAFKSFNIKYLNNGIYFIKLTSYKGILIRKLIVE